MNFPTIFSKRNIEVKMKNATKKFDKSNEIDKKALVEDYKVWNAETESSKDQPHVLYANQINIEQI